jgi:hypothetical protein
MASKNDKKPAAAKGEGAAFRRDQQFKKNLAAWRKLRKSIKRNGGK